MTGKLCVSASGHTLWPIIRQLSQVAEFLFWLHKLELDSGSTHNINFVRHHALRPPIQAGIDNRSQVSGLRYQVSGLRYQVSVNYACFKVRSIDNLRGLMSLFSTFSIDRPALYLCMSASGVLKPAGLYPNSGVNAVSVYEIHTLSFGCSLSACDHSLWNLCVCIWKIFWNQHLCIRTLNLHIFIIEYSYT